jgi:hypothetical protein
MLLVDDLIRGSKYDMHIGRSVGQLKKTGRHNKVVLDAVIT